jgi:hypothetical protein
MIKNLHAHVQLRPPACRLNEDGLPLKAIAYSGENDEWYVEDVSDSGLRLSHRSGHVKTLSYDQVHSFLENEPRQGNKRGFLILKVQLFIQGNSISVEPNGRPGEPVLPKAPKSELVEFNHPVASGIQPRLEALGYKLAWVNPERVRGLIDIDDWELVVQADGFGGFNSYRTRDGLVLLKKRL